MNNTKNITLYGIANCSTVKKARMWLQAHGLQYTFHDFKKQGVPAQQLQKWIGALGWEPLLNRKGTTWRKLDAATQTAVHDAHSAIALMLAHPSVIKRPVVEWHTGAPLTITVGFDESTWAHHTRDFKPHA